MFPVMYLPNEPVYFLGFFHRIKDDKMENYGSYIVFISK